MPEESSSAQSEASPPTESASEAEAGDNSTADAKVVIRMTAQNNLWLTRETWAGPFVTHYGASTVRLTPQAADDAFLGENQALLDQWHKDALARGLAAMTIDGYRSSLRRFVRYYLAILTTPS